MFAERFIRARKAAGLSMKALGDEVGLSANAIKKYEHGDSMPSSANLLKLSKALSVRSEYFFRPVKVQLEGVEYRKRANTSQKTLDRINGDVLDQAERWHELLQFYPDSVKPISSFALPDDLPVQIDDLDEVEMIAEQMREAWQVGLNPIHDMVDTLESHGIMIISTSVDGSGKFDGLAGKVGGAPVIVLSKMLPGDRQRFTLAHELGHLVLHGRLANDIDEEKACNRFAGAFLLPKPSLIQHLGAQRRVIEPRELYMLKHEYGISMAAVLYRAGQCGVISEQTQKLMQIHFGKQGWRTFEPGDAYPAEETYLYTQLVYRALGESYLGESKAAELLGIPLSRFHKERKMEALGAAANQ